MVAGRDTAERENLWAGPAGTLGGPLSSSLGAVDWLTGLASQSCVKRKPNACQPHGALCSHRSRESITTAGFSTTGLQGETAWVPLEHLLSSKVFPAGSGGKQRGGSWAHSQAPFHSHWLPCKTKLPSLYVTQVLGSALLSALSTAEGQGWEGCGLETEISLRQFSRP